MQNVIYKDDKGYPELLKQTKGAPKQLYFKYRSESSCLDFSERFSHSRSDFFSPALSRQSGNPTRLEKKQSARSKETYASQKLRSVSSKPFASDFDSSIFENCLAVIGSRRLTTYGERVMEQMVSEIAAAGITIVSGFMYGGDAAAHQAAIKAGGRTIAVMPCGIDLIHPAHQEELYREILENRGLIISEYEGEMKPALWTYPQRNRIVAGLSKALLVIEAEEKSGCLITANCAEKFGRKVFAVPGPITGSVSRGANMLIKKGAEMVLSAKDVLEHYGDRHSRLDFFKRFSPENSRSRAHTSQFSRVLAQPMAGSPTRLEKKQSARSKSGDCPPQRGTVPKVNPGAAPAAGAAPDAPGFEKQIFELLEREALEIDELSRDLEMPVAELSVKLSLMEIKGLIELRGNKYYIK